MIPRQLQLVADVATDSDLCNRGNPKRLDHLIEAENPAPRPWYERRRKPLGGPLLGMDEGSQPLLVPAECFPRAFWRSRHFALQNARRRLRQCRRLNALNEYTKASVADQRY